MGFAVARTLAPPVPILLVNAIRRRRRTTVLRIGAGTCAVSYLWGGIFVPEGGIIARKSAAGPG